MKPQPGVYALIMPLETDVSLRIGASGTHVFPAGWYVYVGVAHGSGGLRRRTDQLRKDRKRHRLHIDCLRAHAPIEEIWFSHDVPCRVHNWAWHLSRMHGATVPVPGFGSRNCVAGCPAHLIRFAHRPSLAAFRSIVSDRRPDHAPVYAEFANAQPSMLAIGEERNIPWLSEYLLGRTYLEMRRRVVYEQTDDRALPDSLVCFSKDPIGKRIIGDLASAMGEVDVKELRRTAKFADAVESIISQGGSLAHRVLFDLDRPQERSAIEAISRKSRERQRERIVKVATGETRTVRPQCGDQAPDTMSFGKLHSRLARACGLIDRCLAGVEQHVGHMTPDVICAIWAGSNSFRGQLRDFERQIDRLEVRPGSAVTKPGKGKTSAPRAVTIARVQDPMWAGLGLLAKNIRDVPRSSYDLRPTRDQLEAVKKWIVRGRRSCDQIRNLCTPSSPVGST